MQATVSSHPGWDEIAVSGEVTSADIALLEEILQRFLTVGRYHVIINMADLTYIGSAGLSLLIRYTAALRRWDRGDLYLAELSAPIRQLLQIASLVTEEHSQFSIYPTLAAAREAVQRQAKS